MNKLKLKRGDEQLGMNMYRLFWNNDVHVSPKRLFSVRATVTLF